MPLTVVLRYICAVSNNCAQGLLQALRAASLHARGGERLLGMRGCYLVIVVLCLWRKHEANQIAQKRWQQNCVHYCSRPIALKARARSDLVVLCMSAPRMCCTAGSDMQVVLLCILWAVLHLAGRTGVECFVMRR